MTTPIEQQKITLFKGYLTTCNDDGSIPLNSQTICCVAQEMTPALQLLIDRWNSGADLARNVAQAYNVAIGKEPFQTLKRSTN